MARVTIGVPVFNAESLLPRALENLRTQSLRDIRIKILDNNSTDQTGAIAKRFVEADERFSYHLQPYNKGCRQNFVDALAEADSPYFMWRAYDDLSSDDYVEKLSALLDNAPDAVLAVGRTIMDKKGRRRIKYFPTRGLLEPSIAYQTRLILQAPPSWIYGLYRTEALKRSLDNVVANYPHVHAFDPLTFLPFLIELRVVGTADTDFIQGFIDRDNGVQDGGILDPDMMQGLRNDFGRYCRDHLLRVVDADAFTPLTRLALRRYAYRSYRWPKILNARIRVFLGETPHASTTKYDAPSELKSVTK